MNNDTSDIKDSNNDLKIKQRNEGNANGDGGKGGFENFNFNFEFMEKVQPVHLIFAASLPLCLGAFAGYKLEMKQSADPKSDMHLPGSTKGGNHLLNKLMSSDEKMTKGSTKSVRAAAGSAAAASVEQLEVNVGRLAFKALGIGSILSIGGVGLLTAAIFRASGCDNLTEMITTLRDWTPRKRRELEDFLGVEPKSMQHEDVIATKTMSEDEEWDFIKKKYIPELVANDNENKTGSGGSDHSNHQ